MVQDLLAVAFCLSAALNAAAAAIAWRHRRGTPAATALAAVCAALALWSAGSAPVQLPLPLGVQRGATYATFVGVLGCVVATYLLARTIADPHHRPARPQVAGLVVPPVLVLAAVATDPWHHLFFTYTGQVGDPPRFTFVYGPLFWAHTTWCYGLLAVSAGHLVRAWWRAHALVRDQITSVLVAAAAPLVGNVVNVSSSDLFAGQDTTPLCFTVTALVAAHAVLRRGLLQVVPVAREAVLDTVTDAVVVVDAGGTVVDLNPAARAMLRRGLPHLPGDPVGLPATDVLHPSALADLPGGRARYTAEVLPGVHLDVRVDVMTDERGRALGRVVVSRDITEQVRTRRHLEDQLALVERLRARLAEDSVRDPLTGLHNRRFLDAQMATALGACAREGASAGVLVVDVDRFKAVNDTHGHAAGDEVLVAVAAALSSAVRPGDVVARSGGEEFVVLLPGAGAEATAARAEELRAACSRLEVRVAGARVRPTVSIGTAVHPADGADAPSLLAAADRALYAAKAAGRDRVVAAGGPVVRSRAARGASARGAL
ncbi:histidine kinase N-terminal 7TM domain-containing diguanylate cyclase [Kineococcus gypseus]|uniref:histidine kinase N-terminal 7TM domain-containing diguanylate cyclase n=1 Tax=Kineococcus gypseus TaxID=1637102 RepID=UPI003D7C5EAC